MVTAILSFGRILVRPALLWNVLCLGGLAFGVGWEIALVRGLRNAQSPEELLRAQEWVTALAAMLGPAAAGGLLGWLVFDLLLCPFASLLPGIRVRILAGLAFAGVLVSASAAWWIEEGLGAQRPWLLVPVSFFAFSSALCASDPVWRARGVHGAWLTAALGVQFFFARPAVSALESAPWVYGTLAVVASAGLIALPFTRSALRERACNPEALRSPSFRDDMDWITPERDAPGRPGASWPATRALERTNDWVRASLYEASGGLRGGWVQGLFGTAVFWCLLWSAVLWMIGFGEHGRASEGFEALRSALWGGAPGAHEPGGIPWAAIALPSMVTLHHVASALGPCAAPAYPLSRSHRAEVVWRTSLVQNFGLTLAFCVLLLAAAIALEFASEEARSSALLPESVRIAALVSIFAPIAQWFRLRFAQGPERRTGPVFVGALVGIPSVLLAVPIIALALYWRSELDRLPAISQVGIYVAMLGISQVFWRGTLARHHRTRDFA